eukprot:696279-Rhodomonas_salina.1
MQAALRCRRAKAAWCGQVSARAGASEVDAGGLAEADLRDLDHQVSVAHPRTHCLAHGLGLGHRPLAWHKAEATQRELGQHGAAHGELAVDACHVVWAALKLGGRVRIACNEHAARHLLALLLL